MIRATVSPEESDNNVYCVSFSDGLDCNVAVQRSLPRFLELRDILLSVNYLPPEITPVLSVDPSPDVVQLENFLNYWLRFYNESAPISDILINFIEDVPGQLDATQLQFSILRQKIHGLMEQNRQYELAMNDMAERNAQLSDMVAVLQSRVSSSSSVDDDFPVRTSSHSENSHHHALIPSAQMTPIGSETNFVFDFTPRSTEGNTGSNNASNSVSPKPPIVVPRIPIHEPLILPEATNIDDESPRNSHSSAKSMLSAGDVKATAEALQRQCPEHDHVRRFDEAVGEILKAIQPHPSQIVYRNSVAALLKRQIRHILHVNAFECGLHELRCFLPDDPTKLTVILGKSRVAQWHKTLHDRLTILSEQPDLSKALRVRSMDEDFAADQDDEYPAFDHVVGKVQVASEDATFKVDCMVDTTEASISCNRRGDVCMLAFLEEVSLLVGQDDLFKRSLMLIRAWWFYETAAYNGSPIRHYISDSSMCIMVCAIFNQYHARISSPLQALCLFLAEYSAYDGATHAITLQGIVPFKSDSSSQLMLVEPQDHHLITAAVLEKYWVLFNIQEASSSPMYFNQALFTDELNMDLSTGSFMTRGHRQGFASSYCGGAGNAAQRAYQQSTTRFERSGFNVAHPFANANMMEKLVPRRLQKVQKAFALGASQCLALINRGLSDHSPEGLVQSMRSFFAVVTGRFGQGFVRPDRIADGAGPARNSPAAYNDPHLLLVHIERLMSHILYSNFVLESVLSDSALLMLCTEILKEKKIQPVGEVGKMLAEITSSPNLSGKLKEKFGGLKKFLEFYAQRFIFANDHQFNPSVTLRTILDSANLEANENGAHTFNNIHKARRNGSKRTTPITSPDMPYGAMRDSSSSYGATNPSSGSSSRSMNTYSTGSPHSTGLVGPGGPGGPANRGEGYSYGTVPVDARRKVNAFGSSVGVEPPWRTDFDPARPRGVSGNLVPVAEYSPRQGIQRAMLTNRAYPSTVPPPQQQMHDQHLPYGAAPRMSRSQAYAMAQQQAPPPQQQQPYAPNAYPRHFNNRQPQAMPVPPPPHDPRQQFGGTYPPPRSTASTPLYARQGSFNTSPQMQPRELDGGRYSMGGPSEQAGGSYGSQSMYQQQRGLPERNSNAGGHGIGSDVHGYNDILRDIDVSLRLSDYGMPDGNYGGGPSRDSIGSNGGGGGAPGLSNTAFSTTITRPTSLERDRVNSGSINSNTHDDQQKWY